MCHSYLINSWKCSKVLRIHVLQLVCHQSHSKSYVRSTWWLCVSIINKTARIRAKLWIFRLPFNLYRVVFVAWNVLAWNVQTKNEKIKKKTSSRFFSENQPPHAMLSKVCWIFQISKFYGKQLASLIQFGTMLRTDKTFAYTLTARNISRVNFLKLDTLIIFKQT